MARADCPTTEQLCEFFAQIAAGRVTRENLQLFLGNPNFLKPRAGMFIEEARQIPELIIIGPKEIADLFEIFHGSIPNPPLTVTREQLEAKIAERGNKVGLILRLKRIGQRKNDSLFLNNQFGTEGEIKKGLLRSDWYAGNKEATFARQPVCQIKAEWVLADLELPKWSFLKSYNEQKQEVAKRGLELKIVSSDAFDLLLVAAVTGKRYRQSTWGCTADTCGGLPIFVGGFGSDGLGISSFSFPEYRHGWPGRSCEEVVS